MTDRELLELIATKVGGIETKVGGLETEMKEVRTDVAGLKTDVKELKTDVAGLKTDVKELKTDVAGLKTDVKDLKKTTERIELTIEHEVRPKIEALFDGHFQNSDKLERIEKEVTRQEEFILRKVK
jgi:chromosome segregation ATPase